MLHKTRIHHFQTYRLWHLQLAFASVSPLQIFEYYATDTALDPFSLSVLPRFVSVIYVLLTLLAAMYQQALSIKALVQWYCALWHGHKSTVVMLKKPVGCQFFSFLYIKYVVERHLLCAKRFPFSFSISPGNNNCGITKFSR